jgi:hypothetical protein
MLMGRCYYLPPRRRRTRRPKLLGAPPSSQRGCSALCHMDGQYGGYGGRQKQLGNQKRRQQPATCMRLLVGPISSLVCSRHFHLLHYTTPHHNISHPPPFVFLFRFYLSANTYRDFSPNQDQRLFYSLGVEDDMQQACCFFSSLLFFLFKRGTNARRFW